MRKSLFRLICLMGLACSSMASVLALTIRPASSISVIPQPKELVEGQGSFTLTARTPLLAQGDSALTIARFFADKLNASTGFNLRAIASKAPSRGAITLRIDPKLPLGAEGYTLSASSQGITVTGRTGQGLYYGMQTLLQLLPPTIESSTKVSGVTWRIPAVSIKDEPTFEYRGALVDVCRHFLTVDEVKKHIDLLSMFKINRMHWHLTEDQGWRIEIKKYPRLTTVGSKRIEGDGSVYGGFYTQEQVRDIVKYASDRFVTVIPEIELPGHAMGAIASYPELTCFPHRRVYEVRNLWGVEQDVYCPGKETTFKFIQDVLDEVLPLFPSEYVHIGGDECPKIRWKECPDCQRRIKEEGLKNEEELQSYTIRRAQKMLAKHGKKLIGWDEILEGGLAPSATVMSWRGEDGGIKAANMGHDVIMTPGSGGLYIDHYQGDSKIEPVAICCYASLEKVYSYNPIPSAIAPDKRHHIKGAQANLWAEYLYTTDIMQYRAFPRVIALAEATWTPQDRKDYKSFERRLNGAYIRLDQHKVNYHIPLPEQPLPGSKASASLNFVAFTDTTSLTLQTSRPITIVYTTDGSEPTAESSRYIAPIKVSESQVVKVASVLPSGRLSCVRAITFDKQSYSPAVSLSSPTPGLCTQTSIGDYYRASELSAVTNWVEGVALTTQELRPDRVTNHMDEIKRKAVIGEGYIKIPEDGCYVFSTNLDQMYLDGELFIDNTDEVPKFSRHDKSRALSAGWHKVKFIFIGAVRGGFPTYWDDAKVEYRNLKDGKFTEVTAEMLAH
ncbi:family 20 glycosylhydrolase [Porphyromonas catoniae]|nr:family 20 glycosylhydrolase [Porphyromonas catoniae]